MTRIDNSLHAERKLQEEVNLTASSVLQGFFCIKLLEKIPTTVSIIYRTCGKHETTTSYKPYCITVGSKNAHER